MNKNQARGMPNVELEPATQERVAEEKKKIPETEMFKEKNNVSLEIKPVDNQVQDEVKEVKKPKKKLTEKQLEALKRGRERSMEIRKEKAKAKKEHKKKLEQVKEQHEDVLTLSSQDTHGHLSKTTPHSQPQPQHLQTGGQPFTIDYEKIIGGVANMLDQRALQREEREHKVAQDLTAYEDKIREDERNRMFQELDEYEHQQAQRVKQQKTREILTQNQKSTNPYQYAFEIGARQRYRRY